MALAGSRRECILCRVMLQVAVSHPLLTVGSRDLSSACTGNSWGAEEPDGSKRRLQSNSFTGAQPRHSTRNFVAEALIHAALPAASCQQHGFNCMTAPCGARSCGCSCSPAKVLGSCPFGAACHPYSCSSVVCAMVFCRHGHHCRLVQCQLPAECQRPSARGHLQSIQPDRQVAPVGSGNQA